MVLRARKTAVTCKSLFHQGRGLSKNKIARLDFEKKCGVHRFCSDTPEKSTCTKQVLFSTKFAAARQEKWLRREMHLRCVKYPLRGF